MSAENVAVVETAYEDFGARGLDEFVEHWTEDLDHRSIEGAPDDRGPILGREAFRAYLQDWIDTFEEYRLEPIELIDAGGDAVVALIRFGGTARRSGVRTSEVLAAVFSIRGGKIARGREYATRDEALSAAGLNVRAATWDDLDGITATLAAAFEHDPLWSWVFPEPEDLAVWWRFYLESALRYPSVRILGDYAAVAVWIPPDGTELTEDEEERIEALAHELVGPRAPGLLELLARFDASHPHHPPHYYLSLLGTHPDRRGHGLGMGLLAENLGRIDAEGFPAYLESTNRANDRRYERVGFRRRGTFTTPGEERTVLTMWRPGAAG
jgi:ketosteroid isomerase-like protein/GNAT superfamily N-acetyltransferase